MNTRDEIVDALRGNRRDAAPPAIFTQSGTVGQMEACGAGWPEANFDLDKMVELSLCPHRMFGFVTAKVPFCLTVECDRLGADIENGNIKTQPSVRGSPYMLDGGVADVPDLMSSGEFVSGGRCKLVCEAAERIRCSGEDVLTIAGCIDPFSVAYMMNGVDNFLMGMLMEPEKCEGWVEALTPLIAEYARVLSESADVVQIVAEASTEILPPENFGHYIGAPVGRMVSAAKGLTTLHSCGETSEVLESLADLGADGLSLETVHDPEGIFERVGGKVRLLGGIPAVSMLMQGTPEDITESARRYSDIGYALITPECGVPPLTPNGNLLALSHYRER